MDKWVHFSVFYSFAKEWSHDLVYLKSSSFHNLCRQSLDSNMKSSLHCLEDGSNNIHNESLAFSLLQICCSSSSLNIFRVLERFFVFEGFWVEFFGVLEAWFVEGFLKFLEVFELDFSKGFWTWFQWTSSFRRKIQMNFFEYLSSVLDVEFIPI